MPIYSYKCNKCGQTFDKLVKAESIEGVPCVYCKSETRKVFSPVGIIFKGSGFYSTDYKSGSKTATSSTGTKKAESGNKKEDTAVKSDTGKGSSSNGKTEPDK